MHVSGKFNWLVAGLLAAIAAACGQPSQTNSATVAVAANFKPAMEQLEIMFEAETDHDISVVIGSTGALFAQIHQGAPFDVLLAADTARPAQLEANGKSVAGTQFTYAIGQLVLWAPNRESITAEALLAPNLRYLAIANPKHAPYGAAAAQLLQALELEESLTDHLVIGENVGQTMVFVQTRNAELGFIALSQILALPAHERGAYWQVPTELYTPINQNGVLLEHGTSNLAALDFIAYLQSAKAREIIAQMGYQLP